LATILNTVFLFLFILLLFSAFFSGAETSFFFLGRVERYRVPKEKENLTRRWINDLFRQPQALAMSIIIGHEFVTATASVLVASFVEKVSARYPEILYSNHVLLKTILAAAFVFPLFLILGRIIPETVAMRSPQRFAGFIVIPLRVFSWMVTPLRLVLEWLAGGIGWFVPGKNPASAESITEREFRSLVDLSREEGALWESEHQFIHNIFEFGENRVLEVMTPRTDMFCVHIDQDRAEILEAIEEYHYSRIPVYDKDKDDIAGILYSKDLLRVSLFSDEPQEWKLKPLVRKPYFVPQTKKANDLFREFRSKRIHIAVVVDEYGGVAGLVTMEDLLESLFGEILDEYDQEEPQVKHVNDSTVIIPARMAIDECNRLLSTEFPEGEYETMSGFVFDLFGRLPSPGARVVYRSHDITVEKMLGTRILELRIQQKPEASPSPDGSAEAGEE